MLKLCGDLGEGPPQCDDLLQSITFFFTAYHSISFKGYCFVFIVLLVT